MRERRWARINTAGKLHLKCTFYPTDSCLHTKIRELGRGVAREEEMFSDLVHSYLFITCSALVDAILFFLKYFGTSLTDSKYLISCSDS